MGTATLLLLLLKFSAVDVRQVGHNVKLVGRQIGKAGHKVAQVVKRVRRHP